MTRQQGLFVKRCLDVTGSVALLILLSPLLLLTVFLVWINFGSPIIFRDARIGQHATVFQTLKFRSMKNLYGADGRLLPDDRRMTRFSRILRASSFDELPQLWNILKGEMSLIGPRTLLTDYFPYLDAREMRRLDMKPGITGLAQVNGRNSLEWDKRLEMDVWYVDNWSLWLDIRIALKTIPVWLMAQGISTPGFVTSQRLDDSRRSDRVHVTGSPRHPVGEDA